MTETTTTPPKGIVQRLITQPAFVAAVLVLALAAAGLNASVGYMKLHFKKQPVPMARSLASMPADLGLWQQVSQDEPLDPEIEHALGTNEYIFRDFMDTRVVGKETIEQVRRLNQAVLDAKTPEDVKRLKEERAQLVGRTRLSHPTGVINLAVTYYTGLVDTVAHVPDRCYVADGYEPTRSPEVLDWQVEPGKSVKVRYINFEDQTARGMEPKNVAYFFHVNGGYEYDPISGVRLRLQDLRESHGYYAKIEVMNQVPDQAVARRAMSEFVAAELPAVERCLPDWQQFKAAQRQGAAVAAATETTK